MQSQVFVPFHIDTLCLKIVTRHPRVECFCRGFIANERELQAYKEKQARKNQPKTEE